MFENVINEVGLAALTNEQLDELLAMLEKAGYQPAPSGADPTLRSLSSNYDVLKRSPEFSQNLCQSPNV